MGLSKLLSPIIYLGLLSVVLLGCSNEQNKKETKLELKAELPKELIRESEAQLIEDVFKKKAGKARDLKEIKESGILRAVTLYSSTGYFLYRGQTMGFEFDLLENLAEHLDVALEIVVARSSVEMLSLLHEGKVDFIAYGLTITNYRKQYVNFTDYFYLSQQVLVQRKPKNWRTMKLHEIQDELISNNIELIGKTISVRANSSFSSRLDNLMEELGDVIYIDTMPNNYETEQLIEMVVDGEIRYTMADYNIASINASYYPELDISVPMSFSQRIGWAVNKKSTDLLEALNSWLHTIKRKPDFNVIYDRYFESKKDFRKRITDDYYSLESGRISKYDELIKRYAGIYNLDWRLLSSVIYQESQFNPLAKSWAGAQGLMQLMPATAEELGVTDRTNPEDNLKGGIKYLSKMWDKWEDIPDTLQRTKFALASYNCGYYHVRDAARLAKKDQADDLQWDNHVEKYILKLSNPEYFNDPVVHYGYARGIEPFTYVFEIFERFEHYKKFVQR